MSEIHAARFAHAIFDSNRSKYAVQTHAVALSVISKFHHHSALLVVCTLRLFVAFSCFHFIKPEKKFNMIFGCAESSFTAYVLL